MTRYTRLRYETSLLLEQLLPVRALDAQQLLVNRPSTFQFAGTDEPVICSQFGCSRVLTLPEQLAGSKCTGCMNIKPININLIIKFK